MNKQVGISPSILSADFLAMGEEIAMIQDAGARFIHVDVMDGHFVPNLTMGIPLVKALKRCATIPLDVHLMIDNPLIEVPWFLSAGADMLTAHAEALDTEERKRFIDMVHAAGAKAGMAIKPHTPVDDIADILSQLDLVLVMSVEPGFSGQSYIPGSEAKVARVVELCEQCGASPFIEVDGGIGEATAALVCAAGADVLVCGNAVFGAKDPAAAIVAIQATGEAARTR